MFIVKSTLSRYYKRLNFVFHPIPTLFLPDLGVFGVTDKFTYI